MSHVFRSLLRPLLQPSGSLLCKKNALIGKALNLPTFTTPQIHAGLLNVSAYSSSSSHSSYGTDMSGYKEFVTPSPYKTREKPFRHGYRQKFFDGGPLPRIKDQIHSLPQYKPKDAWTEKRALFGQNDYIDILGNGNIKPHELINGPKWIQGFKGHEYARTRRRLKFTADRLLATRPKLYDQLNKTIKRLYKEHNQKRKSHRPRPKYM